MKCLLLWVFSILLTSCVSSDGSLKLGVIADWGGIPFFPYKTLVEKSVGRELDVLARTVGIDAVLALGDNFYLDGVKNINDSRFKNTFENVFDYESLYVPWFVIAGNHDHYGNVSAQIAYSTVSKRWNFPDFYYKKQFLIPNSNMSVDVVMIDTSLMCGNTDKMDPYKPPSLNSANKRVAEKHWKWLEDTLRASKANYLLLCGHYPVYSISEHGPTDCLVKYLNPLLLKYKVSVYLSGHDHSIQHIQVKDGEVVLDYIVTGSTDVIDPSEKNKDKIPSGSLRFHYANPFSLGAFTYIDISSSNMTIKFYRSSGKVLYEFSKLPRY